MSDFLERTERLVGAEGICRLKEARAAVFGIGGVGGYTAEALARSGIGTLDIIDRDIISLSNVNRQIIALHSTIGRMKVDVMSERIRDINPEAAVNAYPCFYMPENSGDFDFSVYDYVIDAVDTVTAKIEIIVRAKEAGVPVISSMGAGNKLHPELFEVADIYETSVCPLAKVMRRELRDRGIKSLKTVYSKEIPAVRSNPPGSTAFVPGTAGLIMAAEVVRDILLNSVGQLDK